MIPYNSTCNYNKELHQLTCGGLTYYVSKINHDEYAVLIRNCKKFTNVPMTHPYSSFDVFVSVSDIGLISRFVVLHEADGSFTVLEPLDYIRGQFLDLEDKDKSDIVEIKLTVCSYCTLTS